MLLNGVLNETNNGSFPVMGSKVWDVLNPIFSPIMVLESLIFQFRVGFSWTNITVSSLVDDPWSLIYLNVAIYRPRIILNVPLLIPLFPQVPNATGIVRNVKLLPSWSRIPRIVLNVSTIPPSLSSAGNESLGELSHTNINTSNFFSETFSFKCWI